MLTLRDTTMWTVAFQGTAPDGTRALLHRTRTGARYELVVGGRITGSYGPGEGGRAIGDWARACAQSSEGASASTQQQTERRVA